MAVSTVPALKLALFNRLVADPNLGGASPPVEIDYGPRLVANEGTWVEIGDVDGEQEAAVLGNTLKREEEYLVQILVRVVDNPREGQRTVTERACLLAGHVENSLRTWGQQATAYDQVVRWAVPVGYALTELIQQDSREARVTLGVQCRARI